MELMFEERIEKIHGKGLKELGHYIAKLISLGKHYDADWLLGKFSGKNDQSKRLFQEHREAYKYNHSTGHPLTKVKKIIKNDL